MCADPGRHLARKPTIPDTLLTSLNKSLEVLGDKRSLVDKVKGLTIPHQIFVCC